MLNKELIELDKIRDQLLINSNLNNKSYGDNHLLENQQYVDKNPI